jgi:peroxiredoxin
MIGSPRPVTPGQPAPDFKLPAADREGTVSLSDYRGRSPVLLALFRGLYCPFCRRQIAQLAPTAEKLRRAGVETLGIVATAAERARLYFRFRPARIPLAADPDLTTHAAYGLPRAPLTPEIMKGIEAAAAAWAREAGVPAQPGTAHDVVGTLDGFQLLPSDEADAERQQAQLIGQFLIDRDGIVRWAHLEETPGEFPSDAQLQEIARGAA